MNLGCGRAGGETIRLSGSRYTIIGVGLRGFTGTIPGIPTEFWVPIVMVGRLEFSGVQTSKDTANSQANVTRLEHRGNFRTLRALPGVTAVASATRLPLSPEINMDGLLVPGHHAADDRDGTAIDAVRVGPEYFEVVGVPIVAGRAFAEDDVARGRRVAIINETMARQNWPDGRALGGHFYIDGWTSGPVEMVGIARDHKVRSIGERPARTCTALAGRRVRLT